MYIESFVRMKFVNDLVLGCKVDKPSKISIKTSSASEYIESITKS